jgi:hypothetical protein
MILEIQVIVWDRHTKEAGLIVYQPSPSWFIDLQLQHRYKQAIQQIFTDSCLFKKTTQHNHEQHNSRVSECS